MAKRQSKTRTTLYGAALTFLLAVFIPWVACRLDTSPKILRHPPVERDDADSGDDSK